MGIRDFIERARRAQQAHPQKHDVQLEVEPDWWEPIRAERELERALIEGADWPWCSETEAQLRFLDETLPVWDYGTEPPTNEERQEDSEMHGHWWGVM